MAIMGVFMKSDVDGGGTLTADEFQANLCSFDENFAKLVRQLSHMDMSTLITGVDKDENGYIEYGEYLRFSVQMMQVNVVAARQ